MVPSLRFQQLEARVEALRGHLLPAEFSEVGHYEDSDQVTVLSLSFRVLAHAEIEAYLEDRVVEVAKGAASAWKANQALCRALLSLIAFSGRQMQLPPESLTPPSDNKVKVWPSLLDPAERIRQCVTAFIKSVQLENHGIRERNLLAMLLPVGIQHSELDPVLIADLDSFGVKRGEAAHTTSNPSVVTQALDPAGEYATVLGLIRNIEPLDAQLDGLLTEAREQLATPIGEAGAAVAVASLDAADHTSVAQDEG